MYVDFLGGKLQNLNKFVQQVDEGININTVDFQKIHITNLQTALKNV